MPCQLGASTWPRGVVVGTRAARLAAEVSGANVSLEENSAAPTFVVTQTLSNFVYMWDGFDVALLKVFLSILVSSCRQSP